MSVGAGAGLEGRSGSKGSRSADEDQYPFPSTSSDTTSKTSSGGRPKFSQRALSLFSRSKSNTAGNSAEANTSNGSSGTRTLSYQPRIKPHTQSDIQASQDDIQDQLQSGNDEGIQDGLQSGIQHRQSGHKEDIQHRQPGHKEDIQDRLQSVMPSEQSRPRSRPRGRRRPRSRQQSIPTAPPPAAILDSIPGSLPIVPSYHEKAHPEISAPSQVFNLLDGPTSQPDPNTNIKSGGTLPGPRYQKPAIKIKIITWNMGGTALPKGDLEVLLGRVGGYIPPDAGWDVDQQSDTEDDDGGSESGEDTPLGQKQPSVQIYREDQHGQTNDSVPSFASSSSLSSTSEPHRRRRRTRVRGSAGQEHIPRQDRIPPLPHDDAHPFHLVIVSSQECPWGDGKRIATGLGMAGEISDLARSKSRATHPHPHKTSDNLSTSISTSASRSSNLATTPVNEVPPQTPTTNDGDGSTTTDYMDVEASKSKGGKRGWSDMCEDWLCRGPLAQNYATKGLAATTEAVMRGTLQSNKKKSSSLGLTSEPPSPRMEKGQAELSTAGQQGMTRSTTGNTLSTPKSTTGNTLSTAKSTTGNTLSIPRPSFGRSNSSISLNSAKQKNSSNTPVASGTTTPVTAAAISPPDTPIVSKDFAAELGSPTSANPPSSTSANSPPTTASSNPSSNLAKAKAKQQLHLQIPGPAQRDGTPHSLGAYELIAKERCAMIYMAVYCWRGCRDRVRGVSRSHVKSGMLAGRVGNKGAVGISVKLGQSRLLFVNSHLAAHEGRLRTRLDNVAKIKRELRVDTYLPADDPRNASEDVTEMFDHSFWFGDLNFRVDITRQHADWLMKTKKYDQALEFDQLRKILRDQDSFKGFQESEITFPPTYKYDVLKTLKNASGKKRKQRTIKRILHRRGHSALGVITDRNGNGLLADADDEGDEDDEDESEEDEDDEDDVTKMMILSSPLNSVDTAAVRMADGIREEDGEEEEEDNSSISSSAWDSFGSSGFSHGGSSLGRRNRITDSSTSGHRRTRSEGAVLYSSESDSESTSETDLRLGARSSDEEEEEDPIVTSNTTAAARTNHVLYPFSPGNAIKAKFKLLDLMKSATGSGTSSSYGTSSPTPTSSSSSKRKQSSVSPHNTAPLSSSPSSSNSLHGSYTSTSSQQVATGLNRNSSTKTTGSEEGEQRYDTSAKQRVPSWTDRVLWKSNVELQATEKLIGSRTSRIVLKGKAVTEAVRGVASSGISGRNASAATASRNGATTTAIRTGTAPPVTMTRAKTFSHRTGADSPDTTTQAHPQAHPHTQAQAHPHGHGRLSRFLHHHHHHHHHHRDDSMGSRTSSASASSQDIIADGMPARRPALMRSASGGLTRSASSSDHLSPTLNALRIVSQPMPGDDGVNRQHVQGESSQPSSIDDPPNGPTTSNNTQSSRLFSSWWSTHAPTILTAQGAVAALNSLTSSTSTPSTNTALSKQEEVSVELIGPSKGQVECLLYKSLDDKEMRTLEGRSDHRPVIWVGSIGI
ncbi:unnamed protein product [Sympodiomycopsis kandeliae]